MLVVRRACRRNMRMETTTLLFGNFPNGFNRESCTPKCFNVFKGANPVTSRVRIEEWQRTCYCSSGPARRPKGSSVMRRLPPGPDNR